MSERVSGDVAPTQKEENAGASFARTCKHVQVCRRRSAARGTSITRGDASAIVPVVQETSVGWCAVGRGAVAIRASEQGGQGVSEWREIRQATARIWHTRDG